ncbi:phage shock protein operon transcriptional activator [Arenibaculum pallidiluteum]|uniref:phage shock protein operon transcriptional activator n=1 Tax=Arenibaculum pallidiluteum TaxID=2812559 RepID=UPI001A95A2D0|nr:phage shock protein operon transcriptional activator [Arenibaculum pallidiluteum]
MAEHAITEPADLPTPVGVAPAFTAVLEQVSRLAPLDRPVLVVGERGTGKELIAARLHYLSRRWDRAFVKVNCAALTDSLLDSELFGHEAGAFTGAQRRHAGRFELADGGTLFLDEIATASPRVQEKLLRVLEYGEFERVGGNRTLSVDVRVVGATNADLRTLAATGAFRADLLDRLAFDVVSLPPLRARQEDIPILAEQFGIGMARELGWSLFPGFTRGALETLTGHRWPGNVRELRNAVERAVARAERPDRPIAAVVLDPFQSPWSPLEVGPAPPPTAPPVAPSAGQPPAPDAEDEAPRGGFEERVNAFERRLLAEALETHRFNQKRAAEALRLGYHRFRHHLRRHGLLPGRGA